MAEDAGDGATRPGWKIELGQPPKETRTDPRLDVVKLAVRGAQEQLQATMTMLSSMEEVIRDCAAHGMTRDEIAGQAALTASAVDRVLSGGGLVNWPVD